MTDTDYGYRLRVETVRNNVTVNVNYLNPGTTDWNTAQIPVKAGDKLYYHMEVETSGGNYEEVYEPDFAQTYMGKGLVALTYFETYNIYAE